MDEIALRHPPLHLLHMDACDRGMAGLEAFSQRLGLAAGRLEVVRTLLQRKEVCVHEPEDVLDPFVQVMKTGRPWWCPRDWTRNEVGFGS